MKRFIPARTHGFTLIEVLVAVTLLMGVSAALVRVMMLSFETKEIVTTVNDRYHEGRQVMVRILRELRMSILFAEVPETKREEEPAQLTRFVGEEDEIYFASTAHLRIHSESRESDQSEFAYFLRNGDRKSGFNGKTLYRRESKRLDDKPDRGGTVWPVIEGVKEFKLEYWDDTKEIGDNAWQRSWDSEDNDLLPKRVRVTLVIEQKNGKTPIRFVGQAAPRIRRPISVVDAYVQPKTSQGQARKQAQDTNKELSKSGSNASVEVPKVTK